MFTILAKKSLSLYKFHNKSQFKMKSLKPIALLFAFLLLTQIVKGQVSYLNTEVSVKNICIPVTLMDTIIHDLKERKLLIKKDSLNSAYISILKNDISSNNTKIYQTEKSFYISDSKRKRNGWQRNFFILSTIIITIICTK
jgi:hypothetical protein